MLEKLVAIHLFRIQGVFHMTRARPVQRVAAVVVRSPAILVIPREGPLRDPHLMLFTGTRSFSAVPPGTLVSEDVHVVAHLDDALGEGWRKVADVVVGARGRPYRFPGDRVTRILDRYPSCAVAAGGRRRGCLAGLRDGRLATITEVGGVAAGGGPGPAVYGSFLYGWLASGAPLGCLTTASVLLGRYVGPVPGGPGSLEVSGRAEISLTDPSKRSLRKRVS